MRYSIRPAKAEDLEPMMAIAHEGIRPYFEALWDWVQRDQELAFRDNFNLDIVSIVEVDGCSAGYLKIEEHDDHIYLVGIFLGAQYRRSGLGTKLIQDLIQRARKEQRPIRLRVLTPNPAQHLYRRLGFIETEASATHIHMEFNGSSA